MSANPDATIYWERAVLGCLLENPRLWPGANLSGDDFLLADHRKIWDAICSLNANEHEAEIVAVATEVAETVGVQYVAGLVDGVVKLNFGGYVRHVREASVLRQVKRTCRQLLNVTELAEVRSLVQSMADRLETRDGR